MYFIFQPSPSHGQIACPSLSYRCTSYPRLIKYTRVDHSNTAGDQRLFAGQASSFPLNGTYCDGRCLLHNLQHCLVLFACGCIFPSLCVIQCGVGGIVVDQGHSSRRPCISIPQFRASFLPFILRVGPLLVSYSEKHMLTCLLCSLLYTV